MGMSASQARLCSITARMHDIEYKAQKVEAQKLQLALDKDSIYETYTDALDKTKIQVAYRTDSGEFQYMDANFESVCTYQEYKARQYAVQDSSTGKVYLNRDQADLYELYKKAQLIQPIVDADNTITTETANAAEYARIASEQASLASAYGTAYDSAKSSWTSYSSKVTTENPYTTEIANAKSEMDTAAANKAEAEGKAAEAATNKTNSENAIVQAQQDRVTAIANYETVYGEGSSDNYNEIYCEYLAATSSWSSQEAKYYDRLFNLVDNNNYKILEHKYTVDDDGYTWFNNMVQAGLVTINQYVDQGSDQGWSETSVTTSVSDNYLKEVDDDDYVKKAEAEYEHALDLINDKDKKYDNQLTKLETEEKALTEEIESLEKVRDDNSERTFGIFG